VRIVVIGAGFGGLAAAIRLQAQGHSVTILEALDQPGGRALVHRQDGFVFDAGPTIITAPWLIHELFATAGRRTEDYVQLVSLDPFYNVRFEDGSVFRYSGRDEDIVAEVRRFNADDVAGYEQFTREARRIFATGFELIDKPFLRIRDMLRIAPDLVRLQSWRSVAGFVNGYMKDERLRQVFSFHPLLVGGNPFQTTSIYTLIHHLEKTWGVWFAMGGTGALVQGLARLFTDIGGVIRYSTPVGEIGIDEHRRRAVGVKTNDGELFPADAIVSNADLANTYLRLVPARFRKVNTDARLLRKQYSMSLFVIYFGTDRRYDDVAHHEILMGSRYRALLQDIFGRKTLSGFPITHRPQYRPPAPPGCDARYVLSPVPPRRLRRLERHGRSIPGRDPALPRGAISPGSHEAHRDRAAHRPPILPRYAGEPPRQRVLDRTAPHTVRMVPPA
jgi:phytoene desaturase